jgi:hypothetical protein
MPLLSKPSPATRTALLYITVGALTVVWTGIWYVYLGNNPPGPDSTAYYWCSGFLITGLTLLCIGLALGRIGRAAQRAELVHEQALSPAANADLSVGQPAPTGPGVAPPVPPAAPVAPGGSAAVPVAKPVPITRGVPSARGG